MPKSAQPQIVARLRTYKVQYPNSAPVFHWLNRNAGLTSKQIAAAFGISDSRVRKICERRPYAVHTGPLISDLDQLERDMLRRPLIVVPTPEIRHDLGISEAPDFVALTRRDIDGIRSLESEVEAVSAGSIASGLVEDGLMRLRSYIRLLGRPQSAHRIRLLARLRHHSAWLLIHLGRTRTAIDQARRAIALSAVAFHESGAKMDRERMAETAEILSMAYAMRNHPAQSLAVLTMIRQIRDACGTPAGYEYYRQLGTALLMLGQDEESERQFALAAANMQRHDLPESHIRLFALRQASVLNKPKWDAALETVSTARASLSQSVIAYQTNVNWAVVTGLATGDPKVVDAALQLLGPKPQAFYGHQATIRLLLEITPKLRLSGQPLVRWTRFLMYANLYQDE